MSKWLLIIGVVVVVAGGAAWYVAHGDRAVAEFKTEPVGRQDLQATIAATGTLEPEQVVDIGAQVGGQIISFGSDPTQSNGTIDYGSHVDVGTTLAKIDDRLYRFDLDNARAEVASAKAAVTKAEAALGQLQAKLFQATNDWNRAQQLGPNSGVSQSEMDNYKANYLVAQANVADGRAAIDQAVTDQGKFEAALRKAEQNVEYCTINSPVKGTIIDRRMNVGQTVVSSMTAPSLFLIAKDLTRMQVWAAVNEADVGNIHAGQPVTFTVDARPGQEFKGTVNKVRYNASMTQNVVTYTVEIVTDNRDGRLLPYLTANVKFQLDPRTNAQTVPNAALRWMPRDDQVAGGDEGKPQATQPVSAPTPAATAAVNDGLRDRGTVWVPAGGGTVRAVRVRVGVTDGAVTEVAPEVAGALPDTAQVVVAEVDPAAAGDAGGPANPFVPQFGKKKK